jgi:hypothetical protein
MAVEKRESEFLAEMDSVAVSWSRSEAKSSVEDR